jgi:lysozyme
MSIEGIDIYEGVGAVEWHRVAQDEKSFAFIRGAYGDRADSMFAQNYAGAKAAGLMVGAYHFYRVTRDPQAQAQVMTGVLQKAGYGDGDLPPVIDVEDNPGYDGPWNPADNQRYIAGLRLWIGKLQAATGRLPIIYTRAGFWSQIGNPTGFDGCPLWISNYGVTSPKLPTGWSQYAFWQYSDAGNVDGVHGHCDLNLFNGTVDELRSAASA